MVLRNSMFALQVQCVVRGQSSRSSLQDVSAKKASLCKIAMWYTTDQHMPAVHGSPTAPHLAWTNTAKH